MKPNASLLSIFTVGSGNDEISFLVYRKMIEDIAQGEPYWFESHGRDGAAKILMSNHELLKDLRQWVVIGSDSDIEEIYKELIEQSLKTVTIAAKPDNIEHTFKLPEKPQKATIESQDTSYNVDGTSPLDSRRARLYYTIPNWDGLIRRKIELLTELQNCLLLKEILVRLNHWKTSM